jgi:hypothetical protein
VERSVSINIGLRVATRFAHRSCDFAQLLIVAALTGCSGIKSGLPVDYDVASDPDKGVIVGSVGTNPLGKQWREWSQYEYAATNNPKFHGHVTSAVNKSNPFLGQPECPDDGLPAECANLFAVILPAGKYKFFAVIPARDSHSSDNSTRYSVGLDGYQFEVKPGQATYIGNMLSRLCGGSGYSYYGVASIGRARVAQGDVADRYERDIPLLKDKFPELQNTAIGNETMAGKAWRWEWRQADGQSVDANWQSECAPVRER